jgi:hypothetical protein
MGHPGLLIQDYVAGIPIWYIPNNHLHIAVPISAKFFSPNATHGHFS